MLRNIFFDKKKSVIHHWTYDENDESVYTKVHFKPYLYIPTVESKRIDAYGIDDVPLIKREFDSEWNRYEFLKTYKGKKYFNLPATQQYLLEKYYQKDISELTAKALRMFYYDIEVIADEFPHAEDAKFPITSITIYDTKTLKYYVWGIKPYDHYSCKDHLEGIEPEEIVYDYCKTETDLLKKLLRFWRANFPDLLVGFNSYSFDLPYIVHRMEKVLGEGKSSQLSPVNYIKGHEKENKFAQTYIEYDIGGISHLDYMVLYKTFTPGEKESDGLEFICQSELKVGKLDHGSDSFSEMAAKEWNKFINYNIWDVKLLVMLEEAKRYLEVAKFSAFSGFCNVDKALGKVAIITGIIAKQGMVRNKIISTQDGGVKESFSGGYVKEPIPGLYDDVVVMDLNSLYPNTIITLNVSPETKVGKVMNTTDDITAVYLFKKNTMVDIPTNRFREILEKKNWCISAAGIIFDQNVKGICPEFLDELYEKRKSTKNKMLSLQNELLLLDKDSLEYQQKSSLSKRMDTLQYLYKILLNSVYGVFGSNFFSLYDLDCSKSITMTGQELIKYSEKISNEYMTKEWQLVDNDRVASIDTDSLSLVVHDILEKVGTTMVDEQGDLTPKFVEVENKITNYLNTNTKSWGKTRWNSNDCRFEFKRESACPRAIWLAKKCYVLQIKNKEGVKMDKIKYTGLSVVKAAFSKSVKTTTTNIVKGILESASRKSSDKVFFGAYETFFNLPIHDISLNVNVKTLDKYARDFVGFKKSFKCPPHIAGSVYYNKLVKLLNLENKYRYITNGNKVKLIYVEPNQYNVECIAYLDDFPEEFGLIPDKSRMFERCITNCLEPIYEALSWKVPHPKKQHELSLEDLFG
jgi:DNA polymerase elongation subunit (family B)